MTKEAQFLNDVCENIMEKVALKITNPETLAKFRTATNLMKDEPWNASASASGYRANNAARIADQQVRAGKITPEQAQHMMDVGISGAVDSMYSPGAGQDMVVKNWGRPGKKTTRDEIMEQKDPEDVKRYNEYFNAARQGNMRTMGGAVVQNPRLK